MSYFITGRYKKEIFYNDANNYHVAKIEVQKSDCQSIKQYLGFDGMITIVGYLPILLKDELYHFYGEFIKNSYGMQFQVDRYEMEEKKDEESLVLFLSSSIFKGIGKKTARKIVEILGENAIDKIIKDKAVLDLVPGLNNNKKNNIFDVLILNYESEKIMRFLIKNGFGNRLAMKIFKKYKENTIGYIEENPYRLIDDIEGIGFKKADNLARALNYDLKSPNRIQAAINHIFEEYCFSEGFTYITYDQLFNKAQQFLNGNEALLTEAEINENIGTLIDNKKIIMENDKYYLPYLYQAEVGVATKIQELIDNNNDRYDEMLLDNLLTDIEKEVGLTYSPKQRLAIKEAVKNKVIVLTGGPGTGKTTIVKGFLKTYISVNKLPKSEINSHIALVAPTGRAAKRMSEATGFNAQTIHRLLGYTLSGEFTFNETNRLECKLVVVDESSMIDVLLLAQLLKALKADVKLVFVGDINQLPSVGPGEVLKDIISANIVPVIKLDKIHRQSHNSSIVALAHDINDSVISHDLLIKQPDRNFIRCQNELILDNLKFILTSALGKEFSLEQVQVLAPMYKGLVGIDNINACLQACLNPKSSDKKEINYYNKVFRIGDKVIQLVNRPDLNIMNGDIGYIKHIFDEDDLEDDTRLIVDFEGNEVNLTEQDLNDLSLAYCISIHKSQGSEFDIVVLVLSKSYNIMLRKKLIYTAVTRAKKYLILLGEVEAYHLAVLNTKETIRQTTLKERLTNFTTEIIIDDFTFSYLPEKNLTPYDFLE